MGGEAYCGRMYTPALGSQMCRGPGHGGRGGPFGTLPAWLWDPALGAKVAVHSANTFLHSSPYSSSIWQLYGSKYQSQCNGVILQQKSQASYLSCSSLSGKIGHIVLVDLVFSVVVYIVSLIYHYIILILYN